MNQNYVGSFWSTQNTSGSTWLHVYRCGITTQLQTFLEVLKAATRHGWDFSIWDNSGTTALSALIKAVLDSDWEKEVPRPADYPVLILVLSILNGRVQLINQSGSPSPDTIEDGSSIISILYATNPNDLDEQGNTPLIQSLHVFSRESNALRERKRLVTRTFTTSCKPRT